MKQTLLNELRSLRNQAAHGALRPEHLANRLRDLGLTVSGTDLSQFLPEFGRAFGGGGEWSVPLALIEIIKWLLKGSSARLACDPHAGIGVLAATVHEVTSAQKTLAFTPREADAVFGRVLAPKAEWRVGDVFQSLAAVDEPLDVIVSIPPFGVPMREPLDLSTADGEVVRCRGDVGTAILAAACQKLSPEGIGLLVVTPSFFLGSRSVMRDLPRLGLAVEAAFALPSGIFAPYTKMAAYLLVVSKRSSSRMFVAQFAQDLETNRQVIANFRHGKTDGPVDLGRVVDPVKFRGLDVLRIDEQLEHAQRRFGVAPVRLGDLAQAIQLGRPGDGFAFPKADNALFVPLIGISDVVESVEEMTLKPQNYAQIVVDRSRSTARFGSHFLNSELGRAIRQAHKSGATIPKLNQQGLADLSVFVPTLATQELILEVATRITAQQNTLLGLQNDLGALQRELWSDPQSVQAVDERIRAVSAQMAVGVTQDAAERLDAWFEVLPFPMASILRAWQATQSEDFKTKYEHLLHFFEATAEFLSVIYLSAFGSREALFGKHRQKLLGAWQKQDLTLQRPSFGTWKVVVEYFSKQTRTLLEGNSDARGLCAELFAETTLTFPRMLASKEISGILAATNKMRNDWTGHGGVVSQAEARSRNEQLLGELQKLRNALADGWTKTQLIRAIQCQPRRGAFENEVAVLVGSNSEFLKERRVMSIWLDVERLYLASRESGRAVQLLPLVHVGPSPASATNACYFFNRVEKDGIRCVSYHFLDQPEVKDTFEETAAAIQFIAEVIPDDDN